ncbi:hypothetical protein [Pedomonas mirosovicensis]|uniref:hypothetical protein n=1 Tax=Pedomonas mirosovicensis TaxID=2908641 RepID=UPI002167C64D|nr:hypothetical protein [Pedomonas mirosovicensis]MCH8685213.1 hypothetical protein [Pedomonas mirosovicensis]
MIPALTIAVSGLIDATNRANTAASNIVRKGTVESPFSLESQDAAASYARAAGQQEGPGNTANLSGQTQAQMQAMPRYIPSMAEDVVMMREAVHAYKANANVIRQLDRTTSELLDVLRTDKKS